MMAGLYMIGIHWDGPPKAAALETALSTVGNWLRFDQSVYFLRTQNNASVIYAAIATVLVKADYEIVSKIDESDLAGWAPKWINDWLAGRPYQVPQPPSSALRVPRPPRLGGG
jgi:hypothetical protein